MRLRRMVLSVTIATVAAFGMTLLVPVTSPGSQSAEAALRKNVDTDYTLLRRAPASYVIGTAYLGWTFDAQGGSTSGYRWGRIFGDLNTCIWIYEGAVVGSEATTQSCPPPRTMALSEFTNGQIGGDISDGAAVVTVPGAGCLTYDGVHLVGYGNVRPWQVPAAASAPLPTSLVFGAPVRWRYVSRDGAFVMVRDPAGGPTDGVGLQSWFFLPRGCLPSDLPDAQSAYVTGSGLLVTRR